MKRISLMNQIFIAFGLAVLFGVIFGPSMTIVER